MCGRFALYSSPAEISKLFNLANSYTFKPSYNVAPSQPIPVICQLDNAEKILTPMRWGLIPFWQKDNKLSTNLINARAETIAVKPAFKHALKKRRCLIIANGFYEWQMLNEKKQPVYIQKKSKAVFAMAGIWERWIKEETTIDSCCIITIAAGKQLKDIHDRQPAILTEDNYDSWLDTTEKTWSDIKDILYAYPNDLVTHPVTTKMNTPRFNQAECIKPID